MDRCIVPSPITADLKGVAYFKEMTNLILQVLKQLVLKLFEFAFAIIMKQIVVSKHTHYQFDIEIHKNFGSCNFFDDCYHTIDPV